MSKEIAATSAALKSPTACSAPRPFWNAAHPAELDGSTNKDPSIETAFMAVNIAISCSVTGGRAGVSRALTMMRDHDAFTLVCAMVRADCHVNDTPVVVVV